MEYCKGCLNAVDRTCVKVIKNVNVECPLLESGVFIKLPVDGFLVTIAVWASVPSVEIDVVHLNLLIHFHA